MVRNSPQVERAVREVDRIIEAFSRVADRIGSQATHPSPQDELYLILTTDTHGAAAHAGELDALLLGAELIDRREYHHERRCSDAGI